MKVSPDLHLVLDVGHSSIGCAVLQHDGTRAPNLLGCRSVISQADDRLASQRRHTRIPGSQNACVPASPST